MKKFFVSVGLIAAGTASLQGAYAPDWNHMEASMWRVSGTLRGFYDDNFDTAPSGAKIGSYGFEVSPQLELNVPLQQTELGVRYIYGLYYYQRREELSENPIDQSHQFDLWVDHAFTERWQGRVQDSFVVGQEPELIDPNTSLPRRVNGNNIRNTGTLTLNTTWTRLFSTQLGYQNSFYDYENSGAGLGTGTIQNYLYYPISPFPYDPVSVPTVDASLAGLMNRIEQSVWLNLQWRVRPETMVLVGGNFGLVNYTGNELVALANVYLPTFPYNYDHQISYYSDSRDSRSYIGYLGFQHTFLPNLSVNAQAGFQYSESYNDPLSSPSMAPYAVMSAVYTYAPGSYAQIGFTESQNATDVIEPDTQGRITQNQESSTLYGSINHKLTPKLLGSVIGRWQHSVFNQGLHNNQASDYYNLGVNLSYSFNPHFSADVGYNLDDVVSQVPGDDYTRSRVYLGVSAAY
ncbi:MAG: outer membrane beta-barrel protein [Verrucomicrobiota bacterium]|jgi:hypothetical protein